MYILTLPTACGILPGQSAQDSATTTAFGVFGLPNAIGQTREQKMLKATEVFTPGAFPSHTYIERTAEGLERALRDALDTPGQIVSLIGPSKSGKTVLVEKVVGQDLLITVTGAGIGSPDDIWSRVLDWMEAPTSRERHSSSTGTVSAEAGGSGSIGLPIVGKIEADGKLGTEVGHERGKSLTYGRTGLTQVVKDIANSDYVVLVDDFHYMPRDVQAEAAKSLKEAVRLGVKVCTAAVVHRGDDLVRANPELRGRVRALDLKYWAPSDLKKIATSGFSEMRLSVNDDAIEKLAEEAAGSPQLMQLLCLHTCFVMDARRQGLLNRDITISDDKMRVIFEQVSTATDFRSLVDVLDSGPKTRGIERKLYKFSDGTDGDVYRAVLKAVASDPPRLSFAYEELLARTAATSIGDSPVGSSVTGTCLQLMRLALDKFPNERAIDWDEQKQILDIPDPYLLFYLRWSGRLTESE